MWYCLFRFFVILLRCGWGRYIGVDVGDGMFEVSIVGFGLERLGRNVLTVVVVSGFVCYRMFTVSGDLLFGFAMLV